MYRSLFYFKCILATPLYLIFIIKDRNNVLTKDLRQWENVLPVIKHKNKLLAFVRMFAIFKEYRNLFLYRIGGIGHLLKIFIPCMGNLHFVTKPDRIGHG